MKVTLYAVLALALSGWAASAQGESRPKAGETKVNPVDGAEMVWIPGGEFLMGIDAAEINQLWAKTGWDADSKMVAAGDSPRHQVKVEGFWVYMKEVTNEQYGKFLQATRHRKPLQWKDARFNGPKQPVVGVSWEDAQAYCKWAGVRLPSEAEWEYAARGGDERTFPWGNEYPPKTRCGNFADEFARRQFPNGVDLTLGIGSNFVGNTKFELKDIVPGYDDGYGLTAPVGSFPANPFGLFDMEGNVSEWCADWLDKYPDSTTTSDDYGQKKRVVRGGSFIFSGADLRCSARHGILPYYRIDFVGFRCIAFAGRG